jgi:D-serine deaminase-like pyridoxal phosphate-dependent protein
MDGGGMQPLTDFLARITPPQTPALVIRRAALTANLAEMQRACTTGGVRLRAHGKMHKASALGRLQVAHGAIGLCCQTVGEAETYAAAGIGDLMVTAPLPPWGWPRLAALSASTTIAAVIDSPHQLAHAVASGGTFTLFVDIDPGFHRAGVAFADALPLARAIIAAGFVFGGLQAYAGHLQHAPNHDGDRAAANAAFTAQLAALVADFGAAGLAPPQVSGGGTGTYSLDIAGGVFTEIQAGSYALMDVDYTKAGPGSAHGTAQDSAQDTGDWPFQPALFLAATVVSARHKGFVTCDAGLKAFHSDGPPPRVIVPADSVWRSMGDEHGAIIKGPAEGALVWLQPGHVDPSIALHDAYYVADEDGSLARWPIDARRVSP